MEVILTVHIALLRAVNVGGTGKLPMADLRAACEAIGGTSVQTYINSGNAVFRHRRAKGAVAAALTEALVASTGTRFDILMRSTDDLAALLATDPFAEADAKTCAIVFLPEPPAADALSRATGADSERMALGPCEILVHYPDGMGRSKLRIPDAARGTSRNRNTVAKLMAMARDTP